MEYVGYHDHRWTDNSNESKVKGDTLNKAKTVETMTSSDEVSSRNYFTFKLYSVKITLFPILRHIKSFKYLFSSAHLCLTIKIIRHQNMTLQLTP